MEELSTSGKELIKDISYMSDGIRFADTFGDMIVNNEFKKGYVNFRAGKKTEDAYIYEVLSAIGTEIGDVAYQNVRNYIDTVSDVEICKIKSLKSMMQELGMNYTLFDEYDMYPVELLRLVDIFSIDRKYLLHDGHISEQYGRLLRCMDGQYDISASPVCGGTYDISSYREHAQDWQWKNLSSMISSENQYVDSNQIDDEKFDSFVRGVFKNVILDILCQKYCENVKNSIVFKDCKDNKDTYDYNGIEDTSDYQLFKTKYGIKRTFNQSKIADNIYDGQDTYDNYHGFELSLLNYVYETRKETPVGFNSDPTSRYPYYRRRKVSEYEHFILNKYYLLNLNKDSVGNIREYNLDSKFYELTTRSRNLFDVDNEKWSEIGTSITEPSEIYESGVINREIVENVLDSLVLTVSTIRRIRERIRLQTKKTYMKGTNNLLLYMINEYLNDYRDQLSNGTEIFYGYDENNKRSMSQIEVVEYYDKTPYHNVKTKRDFESSLGGKTCNDRFWEDILNKDGMEFSLQQIEDFYLKTMNMQYMLSGDNSKFLTSFLSTVYDVGASEMSINDSNDQTFVNMKLGRNGEYTSETYRKLIDLSTNYRLFNGYLSTGDYSYDEDTYVYQQISDVTENYIYPNLSVKYLSSYSYVYDTFTVSAYQISDSVQSLVQDYNNLLSGDDSYYFTMPDKEKYPDSFSDIDGMYKWDYYIDNSLYQSGLKYILDKYSMVRSYSSQEDNIVNHRTKDAIESISASLTELCAKYIESVVSQISTFGYVDIESPLLSEELEDARKFCEDQIQQRTETLNASIENVRQQASQLKIQYDSVYNGATNLISQYKGNKDTYQVFSFAYYKCKSGGKDAGYAIDNDGSTGNWYATPFHPDGIGTKIVKIAKVDKNANIHIVGDFKPMEQLSDRLDKKNSIDDKLTVIQEFMDQVTSVKGYSTDGEQCREDIAKKEYYDPGVDVAITTYRQQLQNLLTQYNTVYGLYKSLIEEDNDGQVTQDTLSERISELVTLTGEDEFPDKVFAADKIIKRYRTIISDIIKTKTKFDRIQQKFNNIFNDSEQTSFFQDFKRPQSLTFESLEDTRKYITKTDVSNKTRIISYIDQQLDQYKILQQELEFLIGQTYNYPLMSNPIYTGDYIENELDRFIEDLEEDKNNKYYQGFSNLTSEYTLSVLKYMGVISGYIDTYLSTTISLDSAVSETIQKFNFFEDDFYKANVELFKEYAGNEYCNHQYYTFANQEHPSYQIHPFLWNFVEKGSIQQLIVNSFNQIAVKDFQEKYISQSLSNYIGDFGQIINEWKHGVVDYSGYSTGYENSSHYDKTILTSEVVDYDGSFYPKAVEFIRDDKQYQTAISSMNETLSSLMSVTGCHMPLVANYMYQINHSPMMQNDEIACSSDMSRYDSNVIINNVSVILRGTTSLKKDTQSRIDEYISFRTSNGMFVDSSGVSRIIESCINKSFYERFYAQLDLNAGDIQDEIHRLGEYRLSILDITSNKDLPELYDIYDYGKDILGNTYILFKVYGTENPTFRQKLNTRGELWIRQRNRPFAFPAFTGHHPIIDTSSQQYFHTDVHNLVKLSGDYTEIDDRMRYFYGFTFNVNGSSIAIQTYQRDVSHEDSEKNYNEHGEYDEYLDNMEHSAILYGYPENIEYANKDERLNTNRLTIFDSAKNTSRQESIFTAYDFQSKERQKVETLSTEYYAYLGSYVTGTEKIYSVYTQKIKNEDNWKLSGLTRLFELDGKSIFFVNGSDGKYSAQGELDFSQQQSDKICFSYDQSNQNLVFAYLRGTDRNTEKALGYTIYNTFSKDMNSNDVVAQDVAILRTYIANYQIRMVKNGLSFHNTHADKSYIPVHPSSTSTTDIRDNDSNYKCIELLGKTKDLTDAEQSMNENTNPYYDYSNMHETKQFGRVYEDWNVETDVSSNVRVFTNVLIKPSDGKKYAEWFMQTGIDNLKGWNVIVYNFNSCGKNPIYIGSMTEISSSENGIQFENYSGKDDSDSILSGTYPHIVSINGLNPIKGQQQSSNHIRNVTGMFAKVPYGGNNLQITFQFDVEKPSDSLFIDPKTINVILFNPSDIRQFEKYHMFDVYGAIRAWDLNEHYLSDIYVNGDGWHMIKRMGWDGHEEEWAWKVLKSYYVDKYGEDRFLCVDVELSDYNSLEDVWLFKGDKMLQFKYSEEDWFDIVDNNYYFPTLNVKYPMSTADFWEQQKYKMLRENTGKLRDYFNDDNIYVLDILSADDIEDRMSRVTIDTQEHNDMCYRVFEDALSVDEHGIMNCEKFSFYDEERLLEYAHCFEDDGIVYVKQSEIPNIHTITDSNRIAIDVDRDSIDIEDYIRLYVNYRKNEGQIELYFNYINFIDSPFLEIIDGLKYQKKIEGTYLKLKTGEDGILDIVFQLKKQDVLGNVQGIRDITIARYHIYNISDDKPKFVMNRIYMIEKGSLDQGKLADSMQIIVPKLVVNVGGEQQETIHFDIDIGIVYSNSNMNLPYQFTLTHPDVIHTQDTSCEDYDVVSNIGTSIVTVKRMRNNISVNCDYKTSDIRKIIGNTLPLKISNVIADSEVETTDGTLRFAGIAEQDGGYVLGFEQQTQTQTTEFEPLSGLVAAGCGKYGDFNKLIRWR